MDSGTPTIRYLRVSVTDRCNLHCPYCAPWRDRTSASRAELLTLEEIDAAVREAASLGITKVRVTGGEPLARADVGRLLAALSSIDSLEDLALTTNGTLLRARLPDLLASRFRRVNVHLDTLDPARYLALCGVAALDEVVAGIDAAIGAGLRLKLNAVCESGLTHPEALDLVRFGGQRGIDVRFIEAMPVAGAGAGERETAGRIETGLRAELGLVDEGRDGVARMFAIPGTSSRLGFITPSHARFCAGCDKLRLSCRGILRTCLFAGSGVDLLPFLRAGDLAATRAAFEAAMVRKAALGGREGCEVSTMVGIGG
jgi:cyclic pyranopterin phosphate synthase